MVHLLVIGPLGELEDGLGILMARVLHHSGERSLSRDFVIANLLDHQGVGRILLEHLSEVHHQHLIVVGDCIESVGHSENRAVAEFGLDCRLNQLVSGLIDVGRGLV